MIKKLTDREHILKRPSMYIGAIDSTNTDDFIIESDKIKYTTLNYVPGLIKIINEIIDNSVDAAIRSKFKSGLNINVKIANNIVSVEDDGTGIPVIKSGDHYMPELAWNHTKAGSNFDDANRVTIGTNGVGSYCTNVWSTSFKGITDDGKKRYIFKSENNAESYTEKTEKSKKSGTLVEFKPDLERFNLKEIDETHKNIIYQRLLNLAICYPEINFKFNSKTIDFKSFKNYLNMFNSDYELYENENIKIGIIPNELDDFKQFSFVNGLKIPDGGVHIDAIMNNVVQGIRDKLVKKYKSIKPGDIKNKLMIVCFINGMPNLKFNSQSKEKITNSVKEFNDFANIDYSFINKILKNKSIIDPIIDIYKAKEALNADKALKSVEKSKKLKSEKYFRATKSQKYLCICEGFSAYGGISQVLGNEHTSFYVLKGKPLNSWDVSNQKFAANRELSELYQILSENAEFEDLKDGKFYEVQIDGKSYIMNENDTIEINNIKYDFKDLKKEQNETN